MLEARGCSSLDFYGNREGPSPWFLKNLKVRFRFSSGFHTSPVWAHGSSGKPVWDDLANRPGVCQAETDMTLTASCSPRNLRLRSRRRASLWPITALFLLAALTLTAQAQDHLANATILVIRHAEKPKHGRSLTPAGFARAQAYAHYFDPFHWEGHTLHIDALYAGADSAGSMRPRLTLEPLSHALHLSLNTQFRTDDPQPLVNALRTQPHGSHILIAWRHKHIPDLLAALGADPASLLPNGKWPGTVYDWVIYLHYNALGHLVTQRRIQEPEPLP